MRALLLLCTLGACARLTAPEPQAARPVVPARPVQLVLGDGPLFSLAERAAVTGQVAAFLHRQEGLEVMGESVAAPVDAWRPTAGQGCITLPDAHDPITVTTPCDGGRCDLGVSVGLYHGYRASLPAGFAAADVVAAVPALGPTPDPPLGWSFSLGCGTMLLLHDLELAPEAQRGPWTADDLHTLEGVDLSACADARDWRYAPHLLLEVAADGRASACRTEDPWGLPARAAACVCRGLTSARLAPASEPRILRFTTRFVGQHTSISLEAGPSPQLVAGSGVDLRALGECFSGGNPPAGELPLRWALDQSGTVTELLVGWSAVEPRPGLAPEVPGGRACAEKVLRGARFACGDGQAAEIRGTLRFW